MKGRIVFNGNIQFETDFIRRFQAQILDSQHEEPSVRDTRKVLMITAAWQRQEFDEGHVRKALHQAGIEPRYESGYDANVQNLSIYHEFNRLKSKDPDLYEHYHAKQKVIQQVKRFYREKNSGLIRILKRQLRLLRETYPGISLARVLHYEVHTGQQKLSDYNPWQLLYHYACQDIQASLDKLREHDQQMLQICHEIDDAFFDATGVSQHPLYIQMRDEMRRRIASANSIFIFGGHIAVLANRLNFYRLKDSFREALERGTQFFTVSAGSMCLCDYTVVFDEDSREWTRDQGMPDYELFDKGFGLVSKIQLFPHCKDYIDMDDPDTIAYTAARFNRSLCVGLDQHSFLQLETYREQGQEFERFSSVGRDEGVYLLRADGQVYETRRGEELALPGTQAATRQPGSD